MGTNTVSDLFSTDGRVLGVFLPLFHAIWLQPLVSAVLGVCLVRRLLLHRLACPISP